MTTRNHFLLAIVTMAALAWASPAAAAGKVYRWVDENGVVHFGDAIPPEYSRERHEVLDDRGGRTTVHDERVADTPVHDDRDQALLATYSSVSEIEAVRDRRAGYLESQNAVAQDRLNGLMARQKELEGNQAAINELATTEQRIGEYHAEIDRRDVEIARIREQFEADIARFRELKGLPAPEPTPEPAPAPAPTTE